MKIQRFIGGTLASNGYVIYRRPGGACYIIDPGYVPGRFLRFVAETDLHPVGILLTHLHHDHTGAAAALRDAWDCPVYMHEADAFVYAGAVDRHLTGGETLLLDGEPMQILHTPGHTAGSICILCPQSRVCFTGDTLFDTDLGRTDLPGGSEADLARSVREAADRWENDIVIWPGHDDGCTMRQVRQYNSEFLALRDGRVR